MSEQATINAAPTRDQIAIDDTWDLTTIFESDAAWDAEAAEIPAKVETAIGFQGRLGEGVATLSSAMEAVLSLQHSLARLVTYASLRRDEDTANTDANGRYERAVMLAIQAGEATAFLQPELLSQTPEQMVAYIASPELETYRHLLEDLERNREHVLSQEVEEVLAQLGDLSRAPSEAFSALDNADLTYGNVRDEDGNEIELTQARHAMLQESRDREVRRLSHEAFMEPYQHHANTLTSLYGSSVRKDVAQARLRGYPSARAQALFDDNVPDSVYDGLIETVRANTSVVGRFHDLRKRALGLDELHRYDLRVALAPEPKKRYSFREGVDVVLSGLGNLGTTYVDDLRAGFDSRWVDVHETKGKRSGAFSWGVYGSPPVMLMNWNGTMYDVFVLAHEAGHAMHSFYADRAQPFHLAGYPIFLAEIASTVNEVLLTWHLLGTDEVASDPVARFGLLNRFADTYYATVVNQTLFADFEHRVHAAAEEGQPLTRDLFSDTFADLQAAYNPGVVVDDTVRIGWGRIPHFYRAFYVYQYATGLSAALSIAQAVRDEGDPAQGRYLDMLSAGGSDYPMDILQRAGVDLTSAAPIETGAKVFEETIREMEQLADEGVLELAQAAMNEA